MEARCNTEFRSPAAGAAIVQILALSHYAFTAMLARGANSRSRTTRFRAEIDRLEHELALQQEELRIKNARMTRVPPHRRPHYTPLERMAILELRAARGWSLSQTARRFLVTPATIAYCPETRSKPILGDSSR